MKLIIAGSRTLDVPQEFIGWCINQFPIRNCTEIIIGGATGIDDAAYDYAEHQEVSICEFKPNWQLYGPAAGPLRNAQMAEYGNALLLIWDGESRGSASMKREMEKLNKTIHEVILKKGQTNVESKARIRNSF